MIFFNSNFNSHVKREGAHFPKETVRCIDGMGQCSVLYFSEVLYLETEEFSCTCRDSHSETNGCSRHALQICHLRDRSPLPMKVNNRKEKNKENCEMSSFNHCFVGEIAIKVAQANESDSFR